MEMTIQSFATKTGLPPTTLRFYENKQLLVPQLRGENGYRYYTEDQVPLARLIASFRQADVSIEQIRIFIHASSVEKHELLERWRKDVEEKLQSLQVAKQYLHGVFPEQSAVQLVKWDEPSIIVWFHHEIVQSKHPYEEPIEIGIKRLAEIGILTAHGAFIRLLAAKGDMLQVDIGFRLLSNHTLKEKLQLPIEWNCSLEKYQPTLFITLECQANDRFMCIQYTRMIDKFGFKPIGPRWDWYEAGRATTYYAYIPVVSKDA